jgi:mannose-6-phosphate isomerase-like protein (cupin superfamily)
VQKEAVDMIIRGSELAEGKNGLKLYPLTSDEIAGQHFGTWVTTPETPFGPHRHEQRELWFIMEGRAVISLDGQELTVEVGDLIELPPWVEHGLRTDGQVRWICMG